MDMNRAYFMKKEQRTPQWRVIDATGKVVGRLATEIADALRGKDRAIYTPHTDGGDYIVVINAEKVVFTGNKMEEKEYIWYTGWIGGQKHATAKDFMRKDPTEILRRAVIGMLPKNKLARNMHTKLKIYVGAEHPHTAQVLTSAAQAAQ